MLLILKKAVRLPLEIWSAQTLAAIDFSRYWLKLALFSLLLSGVFSAVIVLARTPGVAGWIQDPLFARKSLVLHVNLALVVWFYSFLAVLFRSMNPKANGLQSAVAIKLSISGVLFMILSIFFKSSEPVLSNYIPVLDHPLFWGGLILFGCGLLLTFSSGISVDSKDKSLFPSFFIGSARRTIRFAGFLVLVAFLTFIISAMMTPEYIHTGLYYERVMWGGGHILQFANVLGMLTVWLILLSRLTGKDIVGNRINKILIWMLVLPAAASPMLLLRGTDSQLYYAGFTVLMRWFIFPVVMAYLILGVRAIWQSRKRILSKGPLLKNFLFNGWMVSALLTVTGFGIGAMIRSSNTLIPAHYHASLGGVTVAYMVMVFLLMREYGYNMKGLKSYRMVRWQPLLFGFGQTIFVIGFAWAGMQGMGRKLFGQDQSIDSLEAWAGLSAMSLGGVMAMAGGILFVYIIIKSYSNGNSQLSANHKQ
ncbi:MAG: cbb3-type cytochrome c oxidase subunit I [Balneolaceae bacterium]